MTENERTIGRLEAHVEDLRRDVLALREDVGELKALLEQARGAKWVVGLTAGLLSFGSTVAAMASGLFARH